jgi:murein DD-endopeptidase MepM/ murein hydrolase activator NlpD
MIMAWFRRTFETAGGRAGGAAAARRSASGDPASGAAPFAVLVVGLAVGLAVWAPWNMDAQTSLSNYAARPEAVPASTTAPAAPLASVPATVPAASRSEDQTRPLGLPVQGNTWVILRDYADHGGPGPNGAVDIGIAGSQDATGTPLRATHEGTVRVLRNNKLYGNLVAIKNGRWSTTYGHLDQVLVSEGQVVRRGDVVGTLGATGTATSPQVD